MRQKLKHLTGDPLVDQAVKAKNGDVFEIKDESLAKSFCVTCFRAGRAAKRKATYTKSIYHVMVLDRGVDKEFVEVSA